MADFQNKDLKIIFADSTGATKTTSVSKPKADLSNEIVAKAMDDMLKTKVLATKNGPVSAKKAAYIQTVTRDSFDVVS